MKKLEIDKDRMLKAAEGCPKVKKFCKIMWPEEFEPVLWVDVAKECSYFSKYGYLYIAYQKEKIGVISHDGPRIFEGSEGSFRIEQGGHDGEDHYNFLILKRK